MKNKFLMEYSLLIFPNVWLHKCNRCKYTWSSGKFNPKTCANKLCRSPYWNKERKNYKKTDSTNEILEDIKFYTKHLKESLVRLSYDTEFGVKDKSELKNQLEILENSLVSKIRNISNEYKRKNTSHSKKNV